MFLDSMISGFAHAVSDLFDNARADATSRAGSPTGSAAAHYENTIFPGNVDTMPFYYQGQTNGCGTTSLAMIMSYLQNRPVNREDIDHEVRRGNGFSSPTDLARYARDAGLQAEMYNNGTLDELRGFVDRGIPCQALISADGSGDVSSMHYVAVTGYGADDKGEYVVIHNSALWDDPATAAHESEQKVPVKDFLQKWQSPPAGFDNFFIAYAQHGVGLPSSRLDGVEGTLAAVDGAAGLVNSIDRIGHADSVGEFAHGVFGFFGAVPQTVAGGISAGVGLGAGWVHDKLDQVPVVGHALGSGFGMIESGAAAIGDAVSAGGQALDHVGSGFEHLVDGDVAGFAGDLWKSGQDLTLGAGDVGADLLRGAGHAFDDWGIPLMPSVLDGLGQGVDALSHGFDGALGHLGSSVDDLLKGDFSGLGKDVLGAGEDLLFGIGGSLASVGTGVVNGVVDAAKGVGNAISDAGKAVEDFFSGW